MTHAIHDFTYDGTLEGLLSVYLKCIVMKTRPLDIKPDFMVRGSPYEQKYMYVRPNATLANRLYAYLGECASVRVQQMVIDCFLTSLPSMELDLYELICRAIRVGGSVADDYEDVNIRRIQMAIRDLYRESQTLVQSLELTDENGVFVTSLNPRNRILPLIKNRVLNNPEYDDLLIYDRRHRLILMRNGSEDDIIDIRRLPVPSIRNPREVYEVFWPYIKEEYQPPYSFPSGVKARVGRNSGGLDPLWHIA